MGPLSFCCMVRSTGRLPVLGLGCSNLGTRDTTVVAWGGGGAEKVTCVSNAVPIFVWRVALDYDVVVRPAQLKQVELVIGSISATRADHEARVTDRTCSTFVVAVGALGWGAFALGVCAVTT